MMENQQVITQTE